MEKDVQEKINKLEKQLLTASGQKKDDILLEIITAYQEAETYQPGADLLDTYLEDKPYSINFLYQCGLIYRGLALYEKAESFFDKATDDEIASDPATSASYHELGSINYLCGEDKKALYYYDRAIVLGEELVELSTDDPDLNIYKINLAYSYDSVAEILVDGEQELDRSQRDVDKISMGCTYYFHTIRLLEEVFESYPEDEDISINDTRPYTNMYKAYV